MHKKGRLRALPQAAQIAVRKSLTRAAAARGLGLRGGALPHTLQIIRSRCAAQLNVGKRRASKRIARLYEGLWRRSRLVSGRRENAERTPAAAPIAVAPMKDVL